MEPSTDKTKPPLLNPQDVTDTKDVLKQSMIELAWALGWTQPTFVITCVLCIILRLLVCKLFCTDRPAAQTPTKDASTPPASTALGWGSQCLFK